MLIADTLGRVLRGAGADRRGGGSDYDLSQGNRHLADASNVMVAGVRENFENVGWADIDDHH